MASTSSRPQASLAVRKRSNAPLMSTYAMNLGGLDRAINSNLGNSASGPASRAHTILWVDGVGGYLLWDEPELILGQAFSSSGADVGIVGDLSRQAASIRRNGSDYLLQPLQSTKLDGQKIERSQLLSDGAVIELGSSVKLQFRRPNPLSATAKLELLSIHRWRPTVDAVLLLADCCIAGPQPGSHIVCRDWQHEVLIVQKGSKWQMKTSASIEVNGQPQRGPFPLAAGTRVRGEDFSLSIEC